MKRAVLRRCALALRIGASLAQAQTTSTRILGDVTDPSGAAVSGAGVEVLRAETGEKRTTIPKGE
jgi:hypothetical protein